MEPTVVEISYFNKTIMEFLKQIVFAIKLNFGLKKLKIHLYTFEFSF